MANNLDKILDIISKVATVQQISNIQKPQSTQEASKSGEPSKYIYISMEDLTAMFPGLANKLDINKLLSSLTSKSGISKILSSLGTINIKPVENNHKIQDEHPEDDT
jgi:hypothetical protein